MKKPTLMEQLRSAAQNAQPPQNQPFVKPLLLDEAGTAWDINTHGHSLLITGSENNSTRAFNKLQPQIEDLHNVDYIAIDFNKGHTLNAVETELENVAVNITEAHALSIDLLEELRHRVSTETWEQTILILIKDGTHLFAIREVQNLDLYMEFLTNMQAVFAAGAPFGLKILMEVNSTTNSENLDEDFKNIITLN